MVLRAIRNRCPAGVITTLMTDDCRILVWCIVSYIILFFLHPALSGANACSKVYPGVTHILCRWHVDRYISLALATKDN